MFKVNNLSDLKRYIEEIDNADNQIIPISLDIILSIPTGLMENDSDRLSKIGEAITDIFKTDASIASFNKVDGNSEDGFFNDERFERVEYKINCNVIGAKGTTSENVNLDHINSKLGDVIPRALTYKFLDELNSLDEEEYTIQYGKDKDAKFDSRKIYLKDIKASKN